MRWETQMPEDESNLPQFEFADELQESGKHCATLAHATNVARGFIPNTDDPTATVTFILFEGKTYAVTAGHVIDIFSKASAKEDADFEGYFVPAQPGTCIGPPFVTPPARFPDAAPDIALRPIDSGLPAHLGKRPFELLKNAIPTFPLPYALAVGFPTAEKRQTHDERVALQCVWAVAQGLQSPDRDQVQFWSEIPNRPNIGKLSGMSGGPVFWSDGTAFGLLGFVKEALDVMHEEGEETLYPDPKVNFICQRASYETFAAWAEYADREFPLQRGAINEAISRS
jgi:hypothetical protein